MTYDAKTAYQSDESARTYEQRPVYSGLIGRLRARVEHRAIKRLIDALPSGVTILDCPCGNGRWFEMLARRAIRIVARDVSVGMVGRAGQRAVPKVEIDAQVDDAEALQLGDNAIDATFSFALMKHLPQDLQARVLAEFARVTRSRVICSFAMFTPASQFWWRLQNTTESYPVTRREIEAMAAAAGLQLIALLRVSQPVIGLEYFAVLDKSLGSV